LYFYSIEVWITPDLQTFGYILLNGLIGTALSDYLWLLSVLLTSPVVATLGLSLTIPVSMVCDFIIHGTNFDFVYILGSVLVLIGFIVVNTDNYIKQLFFRLFK
jgi:solute carrier family 35, member F5